ncbi:MAG: site-specific integrase [Campylobacterota bacterium]|nr:site-specific integrase [Campylobacterota bacterium]
MALEAVGGKYEGVLKNKLKNGNISFYIRYRDETGTPVKKKVGTKTTQTNFTVKDAYDKLIETKHKLATGEELPKVLQKKSSIILFEDMFNDYLEWAKVNKKTWKWNDLGVYNKHLSYLAKKDIKTLKSKDFEILKQKKLSEVSPKMTEHILGLCRVIFNHAIRNELIRNFDNPVANGKVKMPKIDNKKVGFLTKDQAKVILDKLMEENKRTYQLTTLCLFTGARFSEVASLTWNDINFDTNLIYFKPTKDGNSRFIMMTDRVRKVVDGLKEEGNDSALVIVNTQNNQYEKMPKYFQKVVDAVVNGNNDAKKNRITTHTLRHTQASWLAQSGVDILHIKEQLGHKRIETTMRYSHLIDNKRHQATLRIGF